MIVFRKMFATKEAAIRDANRESNCEPGASYWVFQCATSNNFQWQWCRHYASITSDAMIISQQWWPK